MRAIGIDVSNALPGLYWLNFFGRPYRDLIGRERLLGAPAYATAELDDGILLCVDADARDWDTPVHGEIERRILEHLGPQYFFSRRHPRRKGVAPDFGIPAAPARGRFRVTPR
jgi:hypothetical protein